MLCFFLVGIVGNDPKNDFDSCAWDRGFVDCYGQDDNNNVVYRGGISKSASWWLRISNGQKHYYQYIPFEHRLYTCYVLH